MPWLSVGIPPANFCQLWPCTPDGIKPEYYCQLSPCPDMLIVLHQLVFVILPCLWYSTFCQFWPVPFLLMEFYHVIFYQCWPFHALLMVFSQFHFAIYDPALLMILTVPCLVDGIPPFFFNIRLWPVCAKLMVFQQSTLPVMTLPCWLMLFHQFIFASCDAALPCWWMTCNFL